MTVRHAAGAIALGLSVFCFAAPWSGLALAGAAPPSDVGLAPPGALPALAAVQPAPIDADGSLDLDLTDLLAEDAEARAIGETASDEMTSALLVGGVVAALDAAALDRLPFEPGGAQWRCLTEAIYYEARGESVVGQVAVAEVILNRVAHYRYPDDICSVIRQGSSKRNACQFSYKCDGRPERMADRRAFERAGKIARVMIEGRPRTLTGSATHYHATWVRPKWARAFVKTTRIDRHVFYRMPERVASN